MPLILPGNVASATASTGYTVDNSCRFNSADSAYLSKTTGTATNTDKCTISFWVKRGMYSSDHKIITNYTDASNRCYILFAGDEYLQVFQKLGGSTTIYLKTDRLFRDHSAWYNIIVAVDTSQVTESDRVKIYVNGVQETSFSSETYPSQNENFRLNESSVPLEIGRAGLDVEYFNGYLSEFVLLDGQTLTPTSFGEFDEDSPTIWKPIDVSGLTFGDNGFYLDFQNSAELGTDVSGNSNTFTENNLDATDQATDTPTNNFCTLNPLAFASEGTLSEGNCDIVTGSSERGLWNGTFGLTKGKWYFEMKVIVEANEWEGIGISDTPSYDTTEYLGISANQWGYYGHDASSEDGKIVNDGASTEAGEGFHADDIVGCYMDLDNNKLYWAVNGVIILSGVGVATTAPASVFNGHYFPSVGEWSGSTSGQMALNFGGCAAFTVSSANQDANGYGNFEYDPSSGTFDSASKDFLAICSKNLGSDG